MILKRRIQKRQPKLSRRRNQLKRRSKNLYNSKINQELLSNRMDDHQPLQAALL